MTITDNTSCVVASVTNVFFIKKDIKNKKLHHNNQLSGTVHD